MIDLKGCRDAFIASYTEEIRAALSAHGLLEDALILINKTPRDNQDVIARRFEGKSRVSWRRTLWETRDAVRADPGFPKHHYIFNHGADFTAEDIAGFHHLGTPVIASINTQHYRDGDPMPLGTAHIQQLAEWGIDGFQIDSCYDPALL